MHKLVCQRCGESGEGESYLEIRQKFKHKEGCGKGIGPLVPSATATPKAAEVEQLDPEEPKPESKKKGRSKKEKSEKSDS